MRLTLRTMLAYLDGVLAPADAELLGKKIDESKFASDLVRRIREVVQKPRLGVPRLEGKGMGLDPNTVADYLETLLPPDRVPDFEKVCLESDAHLAEVAACHQILAMVLGQPADINPASRERMYRVGARVAESANKRAAKVESAKVEAKAKPTVAGVAGPATPAAKAPADERAPREQPAARDEKHAPNEKSAAGEKKGSNEKPRAQEKPASGEKAAPLKSPDKSQREDRGARDAKPVREKPEVPDYLRESRRRPIWPVLATVVFAFVLAVVLLRAMGPFTNEHPLAKLFSGKSTEVVQVQPGTNDAPIAPINVTPKKANEEESPAKPIDDESPAEIPVEKPVPKSTPLEPGDETSETEPPARPINPNSTVPGVDTGKPAEPSPARPPVEPDPDDVLPKKPGKPASETKPDELDPGKPAAAGVVIGRFNSDQQQVLSRFDEKTGDWYRLPKEAPLVAGDRLLVFPYYRPQISLISGVQITVAGESLIELLPADEAGVDQIKIQYGKLTIVTSGKPGAKIGLVLGSRKGVASFDNVDSGLAAEVRNYRYPGDEPVKVKPHVIGEIFATSGTINWAEAGGEAASLSAGEIRTYLDDRPGETEPLAAADIPEWVKGKTVRDINGTAAVTMAEKLPTDRSLQLSLEELTKEKLVEVRSLAIRSLTYLDFFEPFVEGLSDERQKSFWMTQFDSAQEALARGPEPAEKLRLALEALRPDAAATLYRILIGYSPDELTRSGASSGAAKLVEFLADESLDVRVLASESLLRITGKSLSYRPEVAQPRRVQPIKRWEQELNGKTLIYKTLPSPFPERKASAKVPTPAKEPEPKEPAAKEPAAEPADR